MKYMALWSRFCLNGGAVRLVIACIILTLCGCAKYEIESTQESKSIDSKSTTISYAQKSKTQNKPHTPNPNKTTKQTNLSPTAKALPQSTSKPTQQKQGVDSVSLSAALDTKTTTQHNADSTKKEPQKAPPTKSTQQSTLSTDLSKNESSKNTGQSTKQSIDSGTNPPHIPPKSLESKNLPTPKNEPAPLPMQISYDELAKSSPRKDGDKILHLQKDNKQGFQFINIYDENGEILAMLSFKNRQLHGISKIYKNGEVIKEVPYQNGILEGEVISIVGNTRTTQMYKNSKKDGASTTYRNGTIIAKKQYKNDILNGENLFFDAQNIAIKTTYINGKKSGISSGYSRDKLVFSQNYTDDFLSGEAKTYGQNAILKIQRFYKNGVIDGEEIVYDYPSQKPLHKALHKNGVLIGPYQNYDKEQVYFSIKPLDFANALIKEVDSSQREVWHYPNGKVAFIKTPSKVSTYHLNGNLASEFEIGQDSANGSTYNQNGILESKVSFSPNSHIQWLYNADGKSLRTKNEKQRGKNILQTYKNGTLSREIITIEGEDLTIYRGFFAGGQKLQAELYEKDKKVVGGKRYEINGKVIFNYTFRSEDILFDEIFTYSAQSRRAKILP